MTLDEMRSELSEIIAESGVRTFGSVSRDRWLNRGVVDVCRKTLCLKKKVTKNVVAVTRTYALLADWSLTDFIDFAKEGIIYTDNNADPNQQKFLPVKRRTVEWLDLNLEGWRRTGTANQSDNPLYFALTDQPIVVYIQPVPITAVTGGWIIHYHYYPIQGTTVGGLVGTADVPFNSVPSLYPWHHLPVLFAGYRALLKAGSPKKNDVLAEYTAGVKEMKAKVGDGGDMASQAFRPPLNVYSYRSR